MGQRREEKKQEDQRRERIRRKKMQVREKVGSRDPQCFSNGSSGKIKNEKLHAVVARSTCRLQIVQSTPCSEHFWKLRCRQSALHCGAKHIAKMHKTCLDHSWKLRCGKRPVAPFKDFKIKMFRSPRARARHFWRLKSFFVAGAKNSAPCRK